MPNILIFLTSRFSIPPHPGEENFASWHPFTVASWRSSFIARRLDGLLASTYPGTDAMMGAREALWMEVRAHMLVQCERRIAFDARVAGGSGERQHMSVATAAVTCA